MLHRSVLLQESIDGLAIKSDGIYVDGTFGRGGHSRAILQRLGETGTLIAVDKDLEAIAYAKENFSHDKRFHIAHGSFANLATILNEQHVYGQIDGILLDLGVSSPQLDDAARGFSFLFDGPLDMRMDRTQKETAAHFVNHAKAEEMATVFREYGEERYARRIANAIVRVRAESTIETTHQFAEIVKEANPNWEKHKHPATRVFQAIRIYINRELVDLTACLAQCVDALRVGGRLAVISFHSLEDRMVKQFMREEEQGEQLPAHIPLRAKDMTTRFKRIGKAIKPSLQEVQENTRARSAVLRIGGKIA